MLQLLLNNIDLLRFCLWLITDVNMPRCINVHGNIYCDLASRFATEIDSTQVDLAEIGKRFSVFDVFDTKDKLVTEFFSEVLSLCRCMTELYFRPGHPVLSVLEYRSEILSSSRVVGNVEYRGSRVGDESHDLIVVEHAEHYMGLVYQLVPIS